MLLYHHIDILGRQKSQQRLAHPRTMHQGPPPWCNKGAHHFAAFHLRQKNDLAAICNGKGNGAPE